MYHTILNSMYVFVIFPTVITGNATLRILDVSHNDIGDEGMAVISEVLQYNTSLTKLRVVKCGLSVKGIGGVGELYKIYGIES